LGDGHDIATSGYHLIKPVLLRVSKRCIQAAQRPHIGEGGVFYPIHSRPCTPADNEPVDLFAQSIGDMFNQWPAV
jgi:hypothetical protein